MTVLIKIKYCLIFTVLMLNGYGSIAAHQKMIERPIKIEIRNSINPDIVFTVEEFIGADKDIPVFFRFTKGKYSLCVKLDFPHYNILKIRHNRPIEKDKSVLEYSPKMSLDSLLNLMKKDAFDALQVRNQHLPLEALKQSQTEIKFLRDLDLEGTGLANLCRQIISTSVSKPDSKLKRSLSLFVGYFLASVNLVDEDSDFHFRMSKYFRYNVGMFLVTELGYIFNRKFLAKDQIIKQASEMLSNVGDQNIAIDEFVKIIEEKTRIGSPLFNTSFLLLEPYKPFFINGDPEWLDSSSQDSHPVVAIKAIKHVHSLLKSLDFKGPNFPEIHCVIRYNIETLLDPQKELSKDLLSEIASFNEDTQNFFRRKITLKKKLHHMEESLKKDANLFWQFIICCEVPRLINKLLKK